METAILNHQHVSIRQMAKLIGLLISSIPATVYGNGHFRDLEAAKQDALLFYKGDFDALVCWRPYLLPELRWWLTLPRPWSATFHEKNFSHRLTTDASLAGWGALLGKRTAFGVWLPTDSLLIDELELAAVWKALHAFPDVTWWNARILVRCDNQVAVHYLNTMGGRVERLHVWGRKIWDFLESRAATLFSTYIPSRDNPADAYTRLLTRPDARTLDLEVQLDPFIFETVILAEGPWAPTIDWFASSFNAQLPVFCSWERDVGAACIDAFTYPWNLEIGYFFPPFSLIPRIIRKLELDQAQAILVYPWWTGALWFRRLQTFAIHTRQLPVSPTLLQYPAWPDLRHPMDNLQLAVSWLDPSSGRG